MTPEELSERLLEFAARIGKVVDALPETRLGRHIAGQLVRCGTSPAPIMKKVAQRRVGPISSTSCEYASRNSANRAAGAASLSKPSYCRK
jgi:hypothetical protein